MTQELTEEKQITESKNVSNLSIPSKNENDMRDIREYSPLCENSTEELGCRLTKGCQQHAQCIHTRAAFKSTQPLVQQQAFVTHQQTFYFTQSQTVHAGTHSIQQRLSEAVWNSKSAGA